MLIMRTTKEVFTEQQKTVISEYADVYDYDILVYEKDYFSIDLQDDLNEGSFEKHHLLIDEIIDLYLNHSIEDLKNLKDYESVETLRGHISILKYGKIIYTKNGKIVF